MSIKYKHFYHFQHYYGHSHLWKDHREEKNISLRLVFESIILIYNVISSTGTAFNTPRRCDLYIGRSSHHFYRTNMTM